MATTNYAPYFDHTVLKPDAVSADIRNLCTEARTHNFFSVCVNPFWIPQCLEQLRGSPIAICTVVGFPLGANTTRTKIFETEQAIRAGASEIDVTINIGAIKDNNLAAVQHELNDVVLACKEKALVKVIVESGILTPAELSRAIECVNKSGAEFIKTSTGFASTGATVAAVEQMKRERRPGLKIKVSGGIRTAQDFKTYVDLGVHRVGTSKSVDILKDLQGNP